MNVPHKAQRTHLLAKWLVAGFLAFIGSGWAIASETLIRYFPSGPIYEYRWKLLELALAHTKEGEGPFRLEPYAEEIT